MSLDSCPIVLADDPAYLADDPLACAGSREVIEFAPGGVILTEVVGR